jgi:type I restriction-modification system DNA methylase subunit
MPPTDAPPAEIVELIERFRENRADYESGAYKEAQVRKEFIDPFFKALGWDMDNAAGYAEAYKDVVHEDALKITGSGTKAPDYAFRVGGTRRFFVEAKKPSVHLKDNVAAAYQLRRYAWSAKLPLSILTDFDEFAVYDCRIKPEVSDSAAVARVLFLTFEDYVDHWAEIASIFGKEAVYRGSFDRYAADTKTKKGTAEVDTHFLAEMERWRSALAHNIATRNRALDLSKRGLTYAVQTTIDRIVFLRICEDRGLEGYGTLRTAAVGKAIYDRLVEVFKEADARYNSGLFHFVDEKDRNEAPDELTPSLKIDDKVLREIITGLYYPQSPYEFSVLSADILGRAYEQYLGKTIVFHGHKAEVEEKPEVRKAGGVYYTPTFVVDYIVRSTLEPLLAGKNASQASSVRIVDPACGSGSFLIAAYQYLLDWHLDRYLEMKRRPRAVYRGQGGVWRLTLNERKRILLNNIFGVDIDPQAVEIAKLSLLLKVIEGETQMAFAIERLLPDLANNVVCGNSLIGPDFYDGGAVLPGLNDEEDAVINAFDWATAFPEVFAAGGFDAVIGNPPYLNIDDTWGRRDPRLAYLKRAYPEVYNDKTDILFYFLAKAIQIARSEVCFIVSRAFLEAFKADKLRAYLSQQANVREIIDLRNAYVFEGVGITTGIVHFTRAKPKKVSAALLRRLRSDELPVGATAETLSDGALFDTVPVEQKQFGSGSWVFTSDSVQEVLDRIDAAGDPLGSVLHVGQGMQTGRNNVFGDRTKAEITGWKVPPGVTYERARNSDIQRYWIIDNGEYLLYTEAASSFSALPSGVQTHLKAHRAELEDRAAYKRGNCEWWRWTWPLHKEFIGRAKLYCPYLATVNRFALDDLGRFLGLTDTTVLYDNEQPEDLRYVLGLLNSRLLTFRFRYIGKLKSGGILEYFWNSISKLPIRRIEPHDPRHDRMVKLVDTMITLQGKLPEPMVPAAKTALRRNISTIDAQIEDLVADLYGITDKDKATIQSVMEPLNVEMEALLEASVTEVQESQ